MIQVDLNCTYNPHLWFEAHTPQALLQTLQLSCLFSYLVKTVTTFVIKDLQNIPILSIIGSNHGGNFPIENL